MKPLRGDWYVVDDESNKQIIGPNSFSDDELIDILAHGSDTEAGGVPLFWVMRAMAREIASLKYRLEYGG